MVFSTVVVGSVMSLLSLTRAATINNRRDSCVFACPDSDLDGNALYTSANNGTDISCAYLGDSSSLCLYDSASGAFNGGGNCPGSAVKQCVSRRSRAFKQAVVRRGIPGSLADRRGENSGPDPAWGHGSPSLGPKREVPASASDWYPPPPTPTSDWYPQNPPPGPSRVPKPSRPPTQQPCKFRCPQKDLAQNLLTEEAIRDPYLFCSYDTPSCKTCTFCKYSTQTGVLLEDNDDGNCPQTAAVARPWDRRSI